MDQLPSLFSWISRGEERREGVVKMQSGEGGEVGREGRSRYPRDRHSCCVEGGRGVGRWISRDQETVTATNQPTDEGRSLRRPTGE
jgi:hypothetical protein